MRRRRRASTRLKDAQKELDEIFERLRQLKMQEKKAHEAFLKQKQKKTRRPATAANRRKKQPRSRLKTAKLKPVKPVLHVVDPALHAMYAKYTLKCPRVRQIAETLNAFARDKDVSSLTSEFPIETRFDVAGNTFKEIQIQLNNCRNWSEIKYCFGSPATDPPMMYLHLNLASNDINDQYCVGLATMIANQVGIVGLNLSNNQITTIGGLTLVKAIKARLVRHLSDSRFPPISVLMLQRNQLSRDHLVKLLEQNLGSFMVDVAIDGDKWRRPTINNTSCNILNILSS